MAELCYGCFSQLEKEGVCPHCGYDPGEDIGKYPAALRPGTVINDRYLLGRVLGQGGFGITYAARDRQSGLRVAVKEYLPSAIASRESTGHISSYGTNIQSFEQGKEGFMEEANALVDFKNNSHIESVYDLFEANGTVYFVMEYVQGRSLKAYVKMMGGRLGQEEANRILLPIMEALGEVHSKGLVHRDIAPDNIIVTADGAAKLIDFGAARYSTGEQSMSLDVVLKHGYAPVEQYIRRGRQGPYTDVYAMAATYYYALTGKAPQDSVERTVKDELLPPSALGVKLSENLESALLKALSVQPENRFRSMGEFAAAIKGEEKLPRQAPAAQGSAPAAAAARKKLLLPLSALLVLALCIAVGTAAFRAGKTEKQGQEQEPAAEAVLTEPALAPELTAEPVHTPAPAPTAEPEPLDDPSWNYDPLTRTLTISGMGNMEDFVQGYTPDTVPWRKCDFTRAVIEPGVSNIADAAFFICNSLEEIVIPDTVTRIGKNAFYSCDRLSSIELPDSIVMIGESAFEDCVSLERLAIPEGITILHKSLFKGCTALVDVSLPQSMKYINGFAFSGCTALEEITLPEQLVDLGEYAFNKCESLTYVTIPDTVGIINDGTFSGCLSLKSINIPRDIIRIGMGAFYDCNSLSDVYYEGSEDEWGKHLGSDRMSFPDFTQIHFE